MAAAAAMLSPWGIDIGPGPGAVVVVVVVGVLPFTIATCCGCGVTGCGCAIWCRRSRSSYCRSWRRRSPISRSISALRLRLPTRRKLRSILHSRLQRWQREHGEKGSWTTLHRSCTPRGRPRGAMVSLSCLPEQRCPRNAVRYMLPEERSLGKALQYKYGSLPRRFDTWVCAQASDDEKFSQNHKPKTGAKVQSKGKSNRHSSNA